MLHIGLGTIALLCFAGNLCAQGYDLRYKLKAGEQVVSKIHHHAETQTMISGSNEDSSSETTSIKVWEVRSVDADGNMTFVYQIDSVDMRQSVGQGEQVTFNSQTDLEAPPVFKRVAETVSKPLATITINSHGEVLKRDNELKSPLLGLGDLTIALPSETIAVGAEWNVPRELRVRLEDKSTKIIKILEIYRLEKVSAGVATISVKSQPITPVNDPAVEAQLVQQLSRGKIKFDIDNGRLLSKQLDWSESIVGFRGDNSSMRYNATWSEELLPSSARTAATKSVVR
jgi:hypothetical protein